MLVAVVLLSGSWTLQSQDSSVKVGSSAVWKVPQRFVSAAHSACDKSTGLNQGECLIDEMVKAGAPAESISFARKLYKQGQGEFGILTGFHDEGPVAFAWINYPLRANTNYGLALVNGQPHIVNVEDLKLLDKKRWNRVLSSKVRRVFLGLGGARRCGLPLLVRTVSMI